MKKQITFFHRNALHLLELVEVCWVFSMESQSLTDRTVFNSSSHFVFTYNAHLPFFCKPHSFEFFFEGVCLYEPVSTPIISLPSIHIPFLICNWKYLNISPFSKLNSLFIFSNVLKDCPSTLCKNMLYIFWPIEQKYQFLQVQGPNKSLPSPASLYFLTTSFHIASVPSKIKLTSFWSEYSLPPS